MPTYICPKCGYKQIIGMEISVGGKPEHKCENCGIEMIKQN